VAESRRTPSCSTDSKRANIRMNEGSLGCRRNLGFLALRAINRVRSMRIAQFGRMVGHSETIPAPRRGDGANTYCP